MDGLTKDELGTNTNIRATARARSRRVAFREILCRVVVLPELRGNNKVSPSRYPVGLQVESSGTHPLQSSCFSRTAHNK
jgi:hypothetical protein